MSVWGLESKVDNIQKLIEEDRINHPELRSFIFTYRENDIGHLISLLKQRSYIVERNDQEIKLFWDM
jgi:hypothetical protein